MVEILTAAAIQAVAWLVEDGHAWDVDYVQYH